MAAQQARKTWTFTLLSLASLVALAAWVVDVPAPSAEASNVPEKYQDMLHKGLEYLVKNQCKDGHWEGDDGKHPMAMTGIVGLALVMEGYRKPRPKERGRLDVWQEQGYESHGIFGVEWWRRHGS